MDRPAPPPAAADAEFVARLVAAHSRLFRYVAALAPSPADAEDVFQKTLLTAWQERARFDPGRDLLAWLCGVARNHLRNLARSRARGPATVAPDVLDALADQLSQEADRYDRRQAALAACLDRLPARQRELIRAFYQADQTVKQFAAAAGMGVQAAYKAIQRVHDALRACVAARAAGEGAG